MCLLNSFPLLMKNLFLVLLSAFIVLGSFGQQDSLAPPYKRFPTIPPFKLLKIDSSSYFTKSDLKKNRPVLIILFNPDCEYCQHETEQILKNIDEFKDIQIIMSTNM